MVDLVAERIAILRKYHGGGAGARVVTRTIAGREVAVSLETGTVVGTAGLTPEQYAAQQAGIKSQQQIEAAKKETMEEAEKLTGKETAGEIVRTSREIAGRYGVVSEDITRYLSGVSTHLEVRKEEVVREEPRVKPAVWEERKVPPGKYPLTPEEVSYPKRERILKFLEKVPSIIGIPSITKIVGEKKIPYVWPAVTALKAAETVFTADIPRTVLYPIQTAKGIIHTVTHPYEAGYAIGEEIAYRPAEFIGKLAGWSVVSKIVGLGIRKGIKAVKAKTLVTKLVVKQKAVFAKIKGRKVPFKAEEYTAGKIKTHYKIFGRELFKKEYPVKVWTEAKKITGKEPLYTGYDIKITTPKGKVIPAGISGKIYRTGRRTFREEYYGVVKTPKGLKELEGAIPFRQRYKIKYSVHMDKILMDVYGKYKLVGAISRAKPPKPSYSGILLKGKWKETIMIKTPKQTLGAYVRELGGVETIHYPTWAKYAIKGKPVELPLAYGISMPPAILKPVLKPVVAPLKPALKPVIAPLKPALTPVMAIEAVRAISYITKAPSIAGLGIGGLVVSKVKPITKPILKPVLKPVIKPVVKPVVKPILKPVLKPVIKPVVKPVVKPIIKAALKLILKPVLKPILKPVLKPVVPTIPVPPPPMPVPPPPRIPPFFFLPKKFKRRVPFKPKSRPVLRPVTAYTPMLHAVFGQIKAEPFLLKAFKKKKKKLKFLPTGLEYRGI